MRISNLQFAKGSIVFSDNSSHYLPSELVKRPLLVIGNYTHIMSKVIVCSITSRNQPGIRIKLWNYATNSQMIANEYGISTIQPYSIYSISTASITSTIGIVDPFIMRQVEKDVQFFLGFSDEIPEYLKNQSDLCNVEYNYGDETKNFSISTDETIDPKYTRQYSSFLSNKIYPSFSSIAEIEDTVTKIVPPPVNTESEEMKSEEVESEEIVPKPPQYEEFSFHIGKNLSKEEQDLLAYINNFLVIVKDRSIEAADLYNSYCLSGLKHYYKSKVQFNLAIKRIMKSANIFTVKNGGVLRFKGIDFKKNMVQDEPVASDSNSTQPEPESSTTSEIDNKSATPCVYSIAAPTNENFNIMRLMECISNTSAWANTTVNKRNLTLEDNALILLDKCTIEELSKKINQSVVSCFRLKRYIFEDALNRAINVIHNEIYMDEPKQIPVYDLICTMVIYTADSMFVTNQVKSECHIGLFTLLTQTKDQLNYTAPGNRRSIIKKLLEEYQESHTSTIAPAT